MVLHIITGLNDGGAEAVLYRLCKFDSGYHHIVVSLMDEGKYGPLLKALGVDVYCLNMPAGRIRFSGLVKLFKFLRQHKPDVVQTWMYHADLIGGVIGRLAGVKNIVWGVHHTTLVKGGSKRSTIIIAKLNAFLSKFVPKKIIYCAQKSREIQESIGFSVAKSVVVPNGYNVDDYVPSTELGSAIRKEWAVDEQTFLIGHVGRYDPQKDQPNLLQALRILKDKGLQFKAVLVGTNLDSNNAQLAGMVESLDLINEVSLVGRRNDIPAVMNAFDVFVLSSAFGEAFPNVLNEAMACETPCITTDVGDAGVIVDHTGWVVAPRSPSDLADAILQAYAEKTNNNQAWLLRKQACRNRIVENFSIEKMVEGYHRVWFS
jgi:glycosyltransferase involved in cell wall biosynthesis